MSRAMSAMVASVALCAGSASTVIAQEALLPEISADSVRVSFDSGVVSSTGRTEIAFRDALVIRDASWVRLRFDQLQLGTTAEGDSAILKLTSMLDGHVQYLDRASAEQWRNTSAYFNGDGLIVELIQPVGATPSRVSVLSADIGVPDPTMAIERSICDGTDDRTLSDDPRIGRVMPIGCTAWFIDDCNKCMITAGHCGPATNAVIQFNVPLSTSGGTPVAPPPEDQYPVDPDSIQSNGGQGVGNDWAYFGTLPNSNTNLTAYEAQGSAAFTLQPPQSNTQTIRITGYGSTSAPVDPRWDLVQKTHTGPYQGVSGTGLQYRPDTTGGNSGSPVFDVENGTAIGVHTHAGCFDGGGANQGTIITFGPFQDALNNPLGICAGPRPLALNTDVSSFLASGSTSFELAAGVGCASDPDLSTARMLFNDGSGFAAIPMQLNGSTLNVSTPDLSCGTTVQFYFAIDTSDGATFTIPAGGAADPFVRAVIDELDVVIESNFESAGSFADASEAGLIDGGWELGVPAGGGTREDPPTDFDGSGQCWVTDNVSGNSDVDGTAAILMSSSFDLSAVTAPQLSFAIWVGTNDPGDDEVRVEFSDDDGASWVVVDDLAQGTSGWETRAYDVQSFVALTDAFRMRVFALDDPNDTILELGFDAFAINSVVCDEVEACPTDIDGDGITGIEDLLDVLAAFGTANGDTNGDGETDVEDLLAVLREFGSACR